MGGASGSEHREDTRLGSLLLDWLGDGCEDIGHQLVESDSVALALAALALADM